VVYDIHSALVHIREDKGVVQLDIPMTYNSSTLTCTSQCWCCWWKCYNHRHRFGRRES